jgi:hypothetical protein
MYWKSTLAIRVSAAVAILLSSLRLVTPVRRRSLALTAS